MHLPASAGFSTRRMALQDEGDNLKAMAAALHKESGTVEDAISRQEDANRDGRLTMTHKSTDSSDSSGLMYVF